MDKARITEELTTFIRTNYKVGDDDDDFDMDVHLFDYGYIDSFGAVELTSFVEDNFGVHVTDTDLVIHPLNTINEIADFIEKRGQGAI